MKHADDSRSPRKGCLMKKLVPAFMLLIFVLVFSGCEMPPEPTKISEVQYSNLTCDQISQEQYRVRAALAAAHDAQRSRSDYGMGGDFNRDRQAKGRASGASASRHSEKLSDSG